MAKSETSLGSTISSGNRVRTAEGGWVDRLDPQAQAAIRGLRNVRAGGWRYTAGSGQPYWPPPLGGGGYAPPVDPPPNPGDMDEFGNRWMPATGKFEPPNMFSDLNWDYGLDRVGEKWRNPATGGWEGGGGGGRRGGGGGGAVLPPGTVVDTPSGPITIAPRPPGSYQFLTLPESAVSYVPQQYRSQFGGAAENWMRGLGYTPQGVMGRYGETTYAPPAERADPWYFAPSLFEAVSDPAVKPWLQFLFGELGYTGRIPQPV